MRRFTIDGGKVRSFKDFVEATNRAFMDELRESWNGNLDAFNDYLSWPDEGEYEVEILDAANCARSLGHAAQAAWLRNHLMSCHPTNVARIRLRLALAEAGRGQALFEVIREIVAEHPHVRVLLR